MTLHTPTSYDTAVRDFADARKRAAFRQIINRITGESDQLLSYNEVRQQLLDEEEELIERGLHEIPLEHIVGSVGRYQDFTSDFLPKKDSDKERWARVRASVIDMRGWSPIEVYKLGDVYFVKDGNHRVSVARQLGVPTISALVTEVKSDVDLKPDDNPSEVIAQANYAVFLRRTRIDRLRPKADLTMTLAGGYRELLNEIEAHARIVEQQRNATLSADARVTCWYDDVYLPVVRLIRKQGMPHQFPERTETDLYVMLTNHREELEDALGWSIDPHTAASEWTDSQREQAQPAVARLGKRLRLAMVPHDLEDGPQPGVWRESRTTTSTLFHTLVVALEAIDEDTSTLDQAIRIAQWEGAVVNGVYICHPDEPASADVETLFNSKLSAARLTGELATVVTGAKEARPIIKRARWADLVVVSLTHPPGLDWSGRRGNNFIRLVQQSPRPVLAVRGAASPLSHALVGYDGSPKAKEALFLAAHAAQQWGTALTVLTVTTSHTAATTLEGAQRYLESKGISARYVLEHNTIADALLDVASESGCDWLIMGGFGFRPMKHLVLGSTVDRMLREFHHPMLICR